MSNIGYCRDVSAIIVTYNPNANQLAATIKAVIEQVMHVFVIDNASTKFPSVLVDQYATQLDVNLHLIKLQENLGIGTAHNIGIDLANKRGAKFVLLLDQDSQIAADMVGSLRSVHDSLCLKGEAVAALGPRFRSAANNSLSNFVKVTLLGFSFSEYSNESYAVEADLLISSGLLIPVHVLGIVGLMDEQLFIDGVDTEWCFRSKSRGFKLFGVLSATMLHRLGEWQYDFWFMRWRSVPIHKPFRYYYMLRNSLLLYRRGYVPLMWKLADLIRLLYMITFLVLVTKNRWKILKMVMTGVVDGLKGINGMRRGLFEDK